MLPLHPKLVHLPVALAVIVPLVALGVLVAWYRGGLPARAWGLVVGLQVLLVASGIAAMTTGESDHERVERIVPAATIEAHADAALAFVVTAAIVLVAMVLALFLTGDVARQRVAVLAVAGTLGVLASGYRVGHAGGELVYVRGAAEAWTDPASRGLKGPTAPAVGEPAGGARGERERGPGGD
ncbi:MAG: DUF2231 domain-containing protein [Myxococcota bacterium]